MASESFKADVTSRFNLLVELLIRRGLAKNNSGVARLMEQPVQIISKLLSGERIITLEQTSALSRNAQVNGDWLLTGTGEIFKEEEEVAQLAPDELIAAVATAVARHEIPKVLGERIIEQMSMLREELMAHKSEINDLNQRIIKMLELSKKGY